LSSRGDSGARTSRAQDPRASEKRQNDRRHPHKLWLDAARHTDGAVRNARWKGQRLVYLARPFGRAAHDLVHGDE
jgi:hypothetical protein